MNLILAKRRRQKFPHLQLAARPNLQRSVLRIPFPQVPGWMRFARFGNFRQLHSPRHLFGARLLVASVGFFDYRFRLIELRKRHSNLKRTLRIPIKQMVLPPNRLARNALLRKQFTQLGMNPRIIPLPKRTKRIVLRMPWFDRLHNSQRRRWQLIHQLHITIHAPRKSASILRFALWTEHGSNKSLLHRLKPLYPALIPLLRVLCALRDLCVKFPSFFYLADFFDLLRGLLRYNLLVQCCASPPARRFRFVAPASCRRFCF